MIFTALLIPDFGVILDLVGSTTVTLNTFIFPSLFYIRYASYSYNLGIYLRFVVAWSGSTKGS